MRGKAFFLVSLAFLFYSCASKVCPKPEEVLNTAFKEPKDGTYYGYLKVNLLRTPFVIKKQGESEEVKTGIPGVSISTSTLCYEGTCIELPVKPSQVLYGYFPGKYKVESCNGEIVLRSEDGMTLFFEKGTLKQVNYKNISLIYGKRTPEGYFRDITIKVNDLEAKLVVEGRGI